jgi:hypothetical protein
MHDDFLANLDVSSKFIPSAEVFRRLYSAQQEICRIISSEDPSWFVGSADLSLVAGTYTYAMPNNARAGTRIIFAENRESGQGVEMTPTDLRAYLSLSSSTITNLSGFYHFSFQGSRICVLPTPATSIANAIRMWFIPSYGNMVQCRPSAVGTNTLTLYTGDPNYTYNWGSVDPRDDIYNGMSMLVVSGTGAGQIRQISDYDGTTRTVTLETSWSTQPVTSGTTVSTVAIMCPVPEDFHHVVPVLAAMNATPKTRNRQRELDNVYQRMKHEMTSWVAKRQDQWGQTVVPSDYGD